MYRPIANPESCVITSMARYSGSSPPAAFASGMTIGSAIRSRTTAATSGSAVAARTMATIHFWLSGVSSVRRTKRARRSPACSGPSSSTKSIATCGSTGGWTTAANSPALVLK